MYVVATAGHVDHGKSTLVAALTGIDPDRLAEEKRRGLTIDLGFAAMTLPSGRAISFVDVPGHVNFIENMLAGVGVLRECLFVVAATEGWKPQSQEHLQILELFALDRGVIAMTKKDLVDEDSLALVREEIAAAVEGTFLESAPLIETDALHGVGLDAVQLALDSMVRPEPARERLRPRLWIDRSFSMRGAGSVVTGTLTGGDIAEHDVVDLVAMGAARASQPVRVRSVQVHNIDVERATPGHRVAVNVVGVERQLIRRGQALVHRDQWVLTKTVDASLRVLSSLDHPVTRRGAYQLYVGSAHHPVKLRVLGDASIPPGESGLVRLHLPVELPLVMGDRYVLRESGRSETVGGGAVLDVEPILTAAKARPDGSLDRLIAERGWVSIEHLEKLSGQRVRANVGEDWIVHPLTLEQSKERLRAMVDEAGALGLDVRELDERDRALLDAMDEFTVDGIRVRIALDSLDDPLLRHPYVALLESSPFNPPSPLEGNVGRVELDELQRRGLIVKCDDVYFAPSAIERASELVAHLLANHPDGVSASQVKECLGTSRKFALPILGFLDANGVTRRRGDLRVGGPRLPSLDDKTMVRR